MNKSFELVANERPIHIEPWHGSITADIPYIPELVDDIRSYRYVSQGTHREVLADADTTVVGSEGFSLCSAFVLYDLVMNHTIIAHLEPYSDSILDLLSEESSTNPQQALLLYGDQSKEQYDLEKYIATGEFGPINLRKISVGGGDTSWGMAYNLITKQVKILTKKPTPTISTFQAF